MNMDEAQAALGLEYKATVLYLIRNGSLKLRPDGQISPDSVESHKARARRNNERRARAVVKP